MRITPMRIGLIVSLAQRAFAYNHDWAFKVGGRGLQRAVDEVVAAPATGTPVS